MTELVVGDLTDEGAAFAGRSHARERVRRRPARYFDRRAHRRIESLGLFGVDQPHRPLGQAFGVDQRVVGAGKNVDDRIADGDDVETGGGGHGKSCAGGKKLRALRSEERRGGKEWVSTCSSRW